MAIGRPSTGMAITQWRRLRQANTFRRYSPECVEGGFSGVGLPLYEVLGSCPRSECWKMTLLSSVLRRYASWQSHKDHRQGQHGKAHAGIEPPPQATDQSFWAASLTAKGCRGSRHHRGDHPQPPGATQLHGGVQESRGQPPLVLTRAPA